MNKRKFITGLVKFMERYPVNIIELNMGEKEINIKFKIEEGEKE